MADHFKTVFAGISQMVFPTSFKEAGNKIREDVIKILRRLELREEVSSLMVSIFLGGGDC